MMHDRVDPSATYPAIGERRHERRHQIEPSVKGLARGDRWANRGWFAGGLAPHAIKSVSAIPVVAKLLAAGHSN
jgi:hypothetical protein